MHLCAAPHPQCKTDGSDPQRSNLSETLQQVRAEPPAQKKTHPNHKLEFQYLKFVHQDILVSQCVM